MFSRKLIFIAAISAGIFGGGSAVFAAETIQVTKANSSDDIAHPLQAYVNKLKTFSAQFEQITPESDLYRSPSKTGVFELHRPGHLVWEYQQPEQQTILIDGVDLWVYDQDLDQLTIRPLEEIQADIPISWLLFDEKIEQRFDILTAGQRNGADWYNLQPKEATYFQSVEVAIKDGQMTEVWMYAGPDDITKVTFSAIQTNQPLSADSFKLKVPEGTDVIGRPQSN